VPAEAPAGAWRERNRSEGRTGARAFQENAEARRAVSSATRAHAHRVESWIQHPDELVRYALLRQARAERSGRVRLWAPLEGHQAALVQRLVREADAQGLLWTLGLDTLYAEKLHQILFRHPLPELGELEQHLKARLAALAEWVWARAAQPDSWETLAPLLHFRTFEIRQAVAASVRPLDRDVLRHLHAAQPLLAVEAARSPALEDDARLLIEEWAVRGLCRPERPVPALPPRVLGLPGLASDSAAKDALIALQQGGVPLRRASARALLESMPDLSSPESAREFAADSSMRHRLQILLASPKPLAEDVARELLRRSGKLAPLIQQLAASAQVPLAVKREIAASPQTSGVYQRLAAAEDGRLRRDGEIRRALYQNGGADVLALLFEDVADALPADEARHRERADLLGCIFLQNQPHALNLVLDGAGGDWAKVRAEDLQILERSTDAGVLHQLAMAAGPERIRPLFARLMRYAPAQGRLLYERRPEVRALLDEVDFWPAVSSNFLSHRADGTTLLFRWLMEHGGEERASALLFSPYARTRMLELGEAEARLLAASPHPAFRGERYRQVMLRLMEPFVAPEVVLHMIEHTGEEKIADLSSLDLAPRLLAAEAALREAALRCLHRGMSRAAPIRPRAEQPFFPPDEALERAPAGGADPDRTGSRATYAATAPQARGRPALPASSPSLPQPGGVAPRRPRR
jgi:hypothetical protein